MLRYLIAYLVFQVLWVFNVSPAFAEQGHRLIQVSDSHGKKVVLYLSKTKLKWVSKDLSMTIYSHAPWQSMYVLNDAKKLVFKCKPKQYQGHLNYIATLSSGVVVQELPMKLVKRGYFLRYPVSVYTWDKTKSKKVMGKRYFRDAQSVQLSLKGLPESQAKIVRKIYGLPDIKGIPVSFGYIKPAPSKKWMKNLRKNQPTVWRDIQRNEKSKKKKLNTYLKTVAIDKVKMPSVPSGLPKGYKLVKVEQELTRNATAEAGMELMLRN